MSKSPDRIVRVSDLSDAQWRALRVLAAERGVPVGTLLRTALATSPSTRKVFA